MFIAAATSATESTIGLVWILLFVVLEIFSIWFSAKWGAKKGYNPILFGFLGFVFGLIMVVITAVVPYRGSRGAPAAPAA